MLGFSCLPVNWKNRTYCNYFQLMMAVGVLLYLGLYDYLSVSVFARDTPVPSRRSGPSHLTSEEMWLWQCQSGYCVRVSEKNVSADDYEESGLFTSIGECRLLCSRFSTIWPQPTGIFKVSRETRQIDPTKITFNTEGVKGGDSAKAFLRKNTLTVFMRNLKYLCPSSAPDDDPSDTHRSATASDSERLPLLINLFTESVQDTALNSTTDESYKLVIFTTNSDVVVELKSETVFGANYGLQTLSQLFACRSVPSTTNSLVIMSCASISDKPFYPHRGLLLDSSRTYLPVEVILRTLDGMAASKLNVMHWHLTDTHSFPIYSQSVPEFTQYGAYSKDEVYLVEDVKKIVEYAYLRGIRIIVEIDTPSHAGYGWQWGEAAGLGKLAVCVGAEPWQKSCIQPPCGQLNPVNPNVPRLLGKLYSDLRAMFPEDMFHFGGDEVFFPCWLSEPTITDYMCKEHMNLTTEGLLQLWAKFQAENLCAWDNSATDPDSAKSPVIVWSSQLTEPVHINKYLNPERYIIQLWGEKSDETTIQLVALGYKVIMSPKDSWYLDHGFWGDTSYSKWNDVYETRIFDNNIGVLGGEACMWGELTSKHNIDSKIWPRAACVAERLWSDPTTSAKMALPRLLDHADRLISLGIDVDQIQPEWCRYNDGKCFV